MTGHQAAVIGVWKVLGARHVAVPRVLAILARVVGAASGKS